MGKKWFKILMGKNGRDLISRKSPWVCDPDPGEPPNHFCLAGYHGDDEQ